MAHYFDENIGERKPLYGLYAQRQRSIAETPNYMSMGPANAPPAQVEDEEDGINCSPCCDDDNVRRALRAIWLGQVLSLCLCGTGVSSQLLSNAGINAPAAQNLTNYFLLACVYGTALVWRGDRDDGFIAVLKTRGWKYFILALIDVEANYMIVYAYKYTTVTSVQLLDCMTIPTVLLLSWLFLSVRYLLSHIIGVCICLLGIACLIYADILQEKGSIGGSDRPLGDLLCISGSVLYAVSNVSEEFLVKQHSRIEYLAMVGTFGTFIAAIQSAILEHNTLASISWTWPHIGSFALYALCMFIFYSMFTVVLQRTSALMINLATLTADFYSLLFALFLFKDSFHFLYFVSFVVTLSGSLLYTLRPTEVRDADEPRRVCPVFSRVVIVVIVASRRLMGARGAVLIFLLHPFHPHLPHRIHLRCIWGIRIQDSAQSMEAEQQLMLTAHPLCQPEMEDWPRRGLDRLNLNLNLKPQPRCHQFQHYGYNLCHIPMLTRVIGEIGNKI
ncbi:unnamed protein product, partial [Mesorhabditis spiculigera]